MGEPARNAWQQFDHYHAAPMALRAFPQRATGEFFVAVPVIRRWQSTRRRLGRAHAEQLTALGQFLAPVAVGQEAVVTNPPEAIWQHMKQEPPDELGSGKCHRLLLAVPEIVLPSEADLPAFDIQQAVVGDGHPMRVAAYVV